MSTAFRKSPTPVTRLKVSKSINVSLGLFYSLREKWADEYYNRIKEKKKNTNTLLEGHSLVDLPTKTKGLQILHQIY